MMLKTVVVVAYPTHWLWQVKKFGRSGQTKYTHLLDQDTTQWDSTWIQSQKANVGLANRFSHRLGGTGDLNVAAKKKKGSQSGAEAESK